MGGSSSHIYVVAAGSALVEAHAVNVVTDAADRMRRVLANDLRGQVHQGEAERPQRLELSGRGDRLQHTHCVCLQQRAL